MFSRSLSNSSRIFNLFILYKSVVRLESPQKQTHISQGPKGKVVATRELVGEKLILVNKLDN